MQLATDIIKLNPNEQIKQQETISPTYRSEERTFVFVWRGLQAARLIEADKITGGTDFKYWREMLKDLTDDQLKSGLKATDKFDGFLTIGKFKNLCVARVRNHPSYKPFLRLPVKPMDGTETQRRLRAMKAELAL